MFPVKRRRTWISFGFLGGTTISYPPLGCSTHSTHWSIFQDPLFLKENWMLKASRHHIGPKGCAFASDRPYIVHTKACNNNDCIFVG